MTSYAGNSTLPSISTSVSIAAPPIDTDTSQAQLFERKTTAKLWGGSKASTGPTTPASASPTPTGTGTKVSTSASATSTNPAQAAQSAGYRGAQVAKDMHFYGVTHGNATLVEQTDAFNQSLYQNAAAIFNTTQELENALEEDSYDFPTADRLRFKRDLQNFETQLHSSKYDQKAISAAQNGIGHHWPTNPNSTSGASSKTAASLYGLSAAGAAAAVIGHQLLG